MLRSSLGSLDKDGKATMTLDDFIVFATPPTVQILSLERKMNMFFRQLRKRDVDVREPFESKDPANTGVVSLPAFREALIELGKKYCVKVVSHIASQLDIGVVVFDDVRREMDPRREKGWGTKKMERRTFFHEAKMAVMQLLLKKTLMVQLLIREIGTCMPSEMSGRMCLIRSKRNSKIV